MAVASGPYSAAASTVRDLQRAWFAIDHRSLAAFRVLAATAMLVRLFGIAPDVAAFLSDDGVLPRSVIVSYGASTTTSLYFINGSAGFAYGLWFANVLAALALLFGYRARTAAFVCWLLCLSLHRRNPFIGTGGDNLLALLTFWAMFLPIAASASVDSAQDKQQPQPSSHLSIASAGILLQAMYVYFFGGLLKTGDAWLSGGAVQDAMHYDTTATVLAYWFRQFDSVTPWLTHFVRWIEILSPALLFAPIATAQFRMLTVPLLMCMHIGFFLFLDIGNFWLVSLSSLMLFVPAQAWNFLSARYWRDEQRRIVIYYDKECAFCLKTSLILRALFLPREAAVGPAQDHADIGPVLEREQSWVVVDATGRQRLHWDALVFVVRQSLVAKPLAWSLALYGAMGLGRPTYDLIGKRRRTLAPLLSDIQARPPHRLSRTVQAALCMVIALCLFWNVRGHFGPQNVPYLPRPTVEAMRSLGLTQRWGMFAPFPQIAYVVPVVEGRTSSGEQWDLLRERRGAPTMAWPRYPVDAFPSHYWGRYFDRVAVQSRPEAPALFTHYASYLCRRWNQRHVRPERLETIRMTLLRGRTLGRGQSDRTERQTLQFTCRQPG